MYIINRKSICIHETFTTQYGPHIWTEYESPPCSIVPTTTTRRRRGVYNYCQRGWHIQERKMAKSFWMCVYWSALVVLFSNKIIDCLLHGQPDEPYGFWLQNIKKPLFLQEGQDISSIVEPEINHIIAVVYMVHTLIYSIYVLTINHIHVHLKRGKLKKKTHNACVYAVSFPPIWSERQMKWQSVRLW